MGCFRKMNSLLVAVVVVASVVAEAQIPSCAEKLVGCASFLNSTTKPPASCCDPLQEAVTKELTCLCNLYNNPNLLKSFGINVTEALGLPTLCGIPGDDISACPGPTSSPSPPKSGSSPKNNVGRAASTGIFGLLLIWISL